MDSKTRNTTILLVISVFALAIGLVLYSNRESMGTVSGNNAGANVNGTGNFVNGDKLSEDELHAFLNDETFFDYDRNSVSAGDMDVVDTSTLYMIATSVEHDIRVAVTDVFGHPVPGVSFLVSVDGLGEFKDINEDGIITVPDVSAGEYYVALKPVEGYTVPSGPMKVAVKDKLEFKVIDDISFYIVTEDMIDVSVEDTKTPIGTEDYDDTGSNSATAYSDGILGIDVSKYQKDIDWELVADSGVKFAIIRCGYRGSKTGALVEDPYFKRNIEGAKAAGIKVGVYFFTQAVNETEAVEEASMVATLCKDYKLDFPVFIDSEAAGGRADNLDKDVRTANIVAFCKTIESAGYRSGVYASRSWFNGRLNDSLLDDFVIWDAEYRESPLYKGNYKLWQYSSNGKIDGIDTRVDLNMCYTTFE